MASTKHAFQANSTILYGIDYVFDYLYKQLNFLFLKPSVQYQWMLIFDISQGLINSTTLSKNK